MRVVSRLSVAMTALAVALGVVGVAAPSAQASTASSFVSLINSARSSAGLAPYAVRSDLAAVAQGQAARMAAAQRLYHNPSLATQVKGWRYVGENVGYGPDVSTLMSAFMHSAGHRANILDHQFTQVGVGAVTVGGTLWVSMVFRQPLAGSSSGSSTHAGSTTHTTTKRVTSGSSTSRAGAKAKRPAAKAVTSARPAAAPRPAVPAALPEGVRCLADQTLARQLRHVVDLEHTARLVEQAQRMLMGFQCGRHLPVTGVLDPATQGALAA